MNAVRTAQPAKTSYLYPDLDVQRVKKWLNARNATIPASARHLVRCDADFERRSITVVECRPPWDQPDSGIWLRHKIARLTFTRAKGTWQLHSVGGNLRSHIFAPVKPATTVAPLLHALSDDPTRIFWG